MGKTVSQLLAETTSAELTEWLAFYEMEPFGPERGDLQAGIVASTVANANRDAKKVKKPYTPQDFMPTFGERKEIAEPKTAEQLRAKWAAVVAAFGTNKK